MYIKLASHMMHAVICISDSLLLLDFVVAGDTIPAMAQQERSDFDCSFNKTHVICFMQKEAVCTKGWR